MTTVQLEKAKVRAIEQGVRVYRLGGGRYAIPAHSQDGWAYEVVVQDGEVLCNCKAGENGRACKHLGAVLVLLEAEVRMEKARRREEDGDAFKQVYDEFYGEGAYEQDQPQEVRRQ